MGLQLMNAQASWKRGENNNNWCICTPTGKILHILEGSFDQKMAMEAIHFGRKFELEAFDLGLKQGREQQRNWESMELKRLKQAVEDLGKMNEELSEQLERHINKDQ